MNELREITREELYKVLYYHKRWHATHGKEGERADLSYTDLRYVDLLWYMYTNSMMYVDLEYANLRGANLTHAGLYRVKLFHADLKDADLSYADLRHAVLRCSDLAFANLAGADLKGADLQNANLTNVKNFPDIPMACPETGSFIGWKCACGYIIKLEIPEDAKRSSGTGEKCRCNKAKVLSIEYTDSTPLEVTDICSNFDSEFIYKVGETVIADDFDNNRFNECTHGIHFFMNRDLAVYWSRIL